MPGPGIILYKAKEGGASLLEIFRKMMEASSEGRLLCRRSSRGRSNLWATPAAVGLAPPGLGTGLKFGYSSRES